MNTLNGNNAYYSTLGRHLKHELGGVEFKLSDKFKPGKQFKNLSDIVALKCNSFEKYNYNFELEKSVLDDFQIHEMNKIAISN
ncbi:hypothetical protein SNE40_004340 [Patella caerulea]|uniref:UMA domain-containing protein n=1 Tax=Patella caerulea TaxID=87958 RepID=A0AAN8Q5B1_PATCE